MSSHDGFESHETERMPRNVLDDRRTLQYIMHSGTCNIL